MSKSKFAGLLARTRKLFARKDRAYVALIRGDDGRYSEILVTNAKEAGKAPDKVTVPPRPEPGDKLEVFVASSNGAHQPAQGATNGKAPSPTEPWRWTNPSYADEAFFQEFQQILKDERARLFPIEDDAE